MYLPFVLAALVPTQADSLKNFDIEEAVIVASPKENTQLRRQSLSVSLFDNLSLQNRGVAAVKNLSTYAPNFYMPDYGSRLTSAVYIRGIGSRINTPAVGLYVDNIPYTDKSAYDFSFQDIERVDILRGPQGTLYGRNTMGGLLRVFTANPITRQGTDVRVGWTSNTQARRASFTTYLHPAERMGLSVGGYYEGEEGYFRNGLTGRKQDGSEAGGGRLRWSWQLSERVKFDWTASYEYSDEDACPYFLQGRASDFAEGMSTSDKNHRGTLQQNRPSSYRRSLFNTGLGVEHRLPRFTLSSITAVQALKDRLYLDQDFTAADIFSLCQEQKMSSVTEEIVLKSPSDHARWHWTTGVFGMYSHIGTQCPVTFHPEGVDYLNAQMAGFMPQRPAIGIAFTGEEIPFVSNLKTPSVNAALFHQSTVQLLAGLSATIGLRVDYDHRELRMTSGAASGTIPYHFSMSMGPAMSLDRDLSADPSLNGILKHDNWQVLPKGALNYTLPEGLGNVYISVCKGYRSGGYNIQSYSDLSQLQLKRGLMTGVRAYSVEAINSLPLPEAQKQAAIAGMTGVLDRLTPPEQSVSSLYYKPEYTWSYEFGLHHNLAGKMLQLDLSAFYMKTRDQQLARFAESGMGRIMVNAGRSRSCGVEASVRSQLLSERLSLSANYGFTHAVFTNYDLGAQADGQGVDYTGNRVPFVPEHTFSAAIDYGQRVASAAIGRWLKSWSIGADIKGAGRVMWNEANTFHQPFYATMAARAGVELAGQVSLEVWGRNLTDTHYATFAFDSMDNRFAQYGNPRCFGVDVKWHF